MTIVPFSILHASFKKQSNQDKVDKELLKQKMIPEPILASTVSEKFEKMPVSSLEELFSDPDTSQNTFRARFYVVNATSGDDCVQ